MTPGERDRARERIGTATASLAILATGTAAAVSILAWHATTDARAAGAVSQPGSSTTGQLYQAPVQQQGDDGNQGDDGGGAWSVVPGGGSNVPQGSLGGAAAPQSGFGGGVVGSQGS
jgi:hypothetical protein